MCTKGNVAVALCMHDGPGPDDGATVQTIEISKSEHEIPTVVHMHKFIFELI